MLVAPEVERQVRPAKAEPFAGASLNAAKNSSRIANRPLPTPKKLTARETEVLRLILDGKSSKEIAAVLGMAFKTATCHRSRILAKFGVHETVSLLRCAIRTGIIQA